VKATVEPVEGNKVKLSVSVDVEEFDHDISAAFRKIAQEVNIPGFRRGKAPRRVLEARIGVEYARSTALNDALPRYYAEAIREHEVDVIAPPELEITEGEEDGPISFEAVVEIRPVVTVPGYGGLRVTIDAPVASDDEIDAQIERMRNQFAELETVERPAADGDYATIDVEGSQDGEPLEGLVAEDYLYEVGSGAILPELDDNLRGASAGDELTFTADHPSDDEDDPIDFVIAVKEVKARVLPDLDDEWANEASEFDTLAELRESLATRLTAVKQAQAQMNFREKTGEALAELLEEDIPEALIGSEMQHRLNDLATRLQAQGMSLDQWVAMQGKEPDDVVAELREAAVKAVKVDLALRAVAEAEAIECTDDDLDEEIDALAERVEMKPAKVRKELERQDQMPEIRSDIKKRKAFEWLLERVEIVDEDGNPITRDQLEIPSADDADDDVATDADDDSSDPEAPDASSSESENE
jgi:trigger factor